MAPMTTCLGCDGTGLYRAPSSLGPYCFRCKGSGQVKARKPRPAKVRPLSPTRRIADICGGDPTKLATDNTRALDYLGLDVEELLRYRELWLQGVREVDRCCFERCGKGATRKLGGDVYYPMCEQHALEVR